MVRTLLAPQLLGRDPLADRGHVGRPVRRDARPGAPHGLLHRRPGRGGLGAVGPARQARRAAGVRPAGRALPARGGASRRTAGSPGGTPRRGGGAGGSAPGRASARSSCTARGGGRTPHGRPAPCARRPAPAWSCAWTCTTRCAWTRRWRWGGTWSACASASWRRPPIPRTTPGCAPWPHGLDLPIAYGEGERTRWQFRDRLVAGAVDVVQPDVGYTGISELRRIAQLAEAFHVPCAPHLSAGLGVCIAAAVHARRRCPTCTAWSTARGSFALGNAPAPAPARRCATAPTSCPDGPGLGVEPDEAALAPLPPASGEPLSEALRTRAGDRERERPGGARRG